MRSVIDRNVVMRRIAVPDSVASVVINIYIYIYIYIYICVCVCKAVVCTE